MSMTGVGNKRDPVRKTTARPSSEAVALFLRSLAVMFRAGVPLSRALSMLAGQSEDRAMAGVAADIEEKVARGVSLQAAFAGHAGVFGPLQLAMLRVGERTGQLETVLFNLADYEEKRRGLAMRVRSALTYPGFLFLVTTAMLVVIPPFLFQGLFSMLESQKMELPLLTRVVLAVSHFIRSPFFWVLCGTVGVVGAASMPKLAHYPLVRLRAAEWLLEVPVLGKVYRTISTTRFARAMELQLVVGESPLNSLKIAAQASGNPVLEESMPRGLEALKEGCTLVESLEMTEFFSPSFLSLLRAGEESASLPDIMGRTAKMYEEEVDYAVDAFTNLMEPLVMLWMGTMVGVVVVATILPMVKMLQNL